MSERVFPSSVLGKRYIGWPHERWLDIRQLGIFAPMVQAGKWAGVVEYQADFKDMRSCPTCAKYRRVGAFKKLALNSYRIPCGAPK